MTATRDRTGELIDDDQVEHRCDNGWLDRDADQPRPCPVCRPKLRRRTPDPVPGQVRRSARFEPLFRGAGPVGPPDDQGCRIAEHTCQAAAPGADCSFCGHPWWPAPTEETSRA